MKPCDFCLGWGIIGDYGGDIFDECDKCEGTGESNPEEIK